MFSMDTVLQDLDPQRKTPSWQLSLLKTLFHEKDFHQLADQHRHLKGMDMVEQVLEYFDIRCELAERDLEQIPSYGPVVVIANHPIGTLDGRRSRWEIRGCAPYGARNVWRDLMV